MGYAEQQRQPGKHLTGISVVIVFHALLLWAIWVGLGQKVIDIVKPPIETKIIEEIKKPPPPETLPPPPPKMVQVLPTFVPPPEVQIQQPVVQQPTIQAVTPVAPPVFAPPAPPAPPAPVAAPPAPPAQVTVGVACPNSQEIRRDIKYPPQARKDGIEGEVLIEFSLSAAGEITNIEVKSSSNRVFNNVATSAVRQFKCNAQGREARVQVPFSFKLGD
jgi:periplasmic protein TonB